MSSPTLLVSGCEVYGTMLLIDHANVNIIKPTSSMLFLVAEYLLLGMLEGHASIIVIMVLMTCLASIITCMHRHVLAPFLEVLGVLDFVFDSLIDTILSRAAST